MDVPRVLRRLGLAVATAVVAVVVLAAGFFAFLHLPPGQRWLSGKIEENVAGVELDGFGLGWPFRMRATALRLTDAEGAWLEATAPELVWHPWRLARGALDIDRLAAQRVEVRRLPLTGQDTGGSPPRLPESIAVDEVELPITLDAPVLGQRVELKLAGTARMTGGGGPVEIALRAQNGDFARVTGTAGTDYLDLRWYLQIPELARWRQVAGVSLRGPLSGAGVVVGRLPRPDISGRLDAGKGGVETLDWDQLTLTGRVMPDGPWWHGTAQAEVAAPRQGGRPLPVPTASLALAGDLAPAEGRLLVGDFSLLTPAGALRAAGVVEDWGGRAVLRVSAHGPAQGGQVTARGVVSGNLLAPTLTGQLEVAGKNIATGTPALDRLLGPAPRARLAVDMRGERIRLGPSRLSGSGASLWAAGGVLPRLDVWARLDLPQADALVPQLKGAGTAFAHVGGSVDAPAVAGVLVTDGLSMAGLPPGSGTLAFDLPEPARPRGTLSADLRLAGTPLVAQARLDRGKGVRLDGLVLASGPSQIRGDLEFRDGVRGRLSGAIPELRQWEGLLGRPLAGRVEAEAVLDPERGQSVRVSARGADLAVDGLAIPTAAVQAAAAGLAGKARQLDLEALELTAATIPVRLDAPARVTWQGDTVSLPGAQFSVGGGQVALSGRASGGTVTATARLAALPLALAGIDATGTVNGSISADGPLAAPQVRFALAGRDLGLAAAQPAALGRLRGEAEGEWRENVLRGRAELTDGRALRVTAQGSAALPGDGALSARVQAQGDVARLAEALPLGAHVISGRLEAAATIGGTIAAPLLSGNAVLRGGRYENLDSGTIVSPLQAEAQMNGDRVALSAKGGDGGRGTLSVTGAAGLDGAYAADVVFDRFTALRRDDVEASATGTLRVADGRIAGTLTVPRAEVDVGRLRGGGPVSLDVVEINRPGQPPPPTRSDGPRRDGPRQAQEGGPDIALAVHVEVNRAFVRGRGLDSEWQGAVDAAGTLAQPSLTGKLTAARGQVDVLGKTFKLTEDSAVTFQGGDTIDPALDVTAEASAADITAQVKLTGTAKAPEMAFTSSPPLPQDEVLARLLFGREAGKLSAFQQLQLAQMAAGGLTGAGEGFDPVGDLRGFLGLDVLGVGSETDRATGKESPTLSAGRYIGRDTFVRVDQGTAGLGRVTVEQGLGGGFSVESFMGEQSGGGVGLGWRKDY